MKRGFGVFGLRGEQGSIVIGLLTEVAQFISSAGGIGRSAEVGGGGRGGHAPTKVPKADAQPF